MRRKKRKFPASLTKFPSNKVLRTEVSEDLKLAMHRVSRSIGCLCRAYEEMKRLQTAAACDSSAAAFQSIGDKLTIGQSIGDKLTIGDIQSAVVSNIVPELHFARGLLSDGTVQNVLDKPTESDLAEAKSLYDDICLQPEPFQVHFRNCLWADEFAAGGLIKYISMINPQTVRQTLPLLIKSMPK